MPSIAETEAAIDLIDADVGDFVCQMLSICNEDRDFVTCLGAEVARYVAMKLATEQTHANRAGLLSCLS